MTLGGVEVSIGVISFPCPKCSASTPVDVMGVQSADRFVCAITRCGFARTFGESFPSVRRLLNQHAHLAPDIARAKIVDAMTAWYLDWSDLRD